MLRGLLGMYLGVKRKDRSVRIHASDPEDLINPARWIFWIIFRNLPPWAPGFVIFLFGAFFLGKYFKVV